MENLYKYCLRLADNSLILSHRLAEYSSKGPYLEEDLAISNVALDHIGQAELFLNYAAQLRNDGTTADDIAFRRAEKKYLNSQLVEQPNTNFAYIMARQLYIDAYNFLLYTQLKESSDKTISAIATKSLKEVTYHFRRSKEWVIRLGDGTAVSKSKMQEAIDDLWMYTGDLFMEDEIDKEMILKGISFDQSELKMEWKKIIEETIVEAKIKMPENQYVITGGKIGNHSEHLGHIISDMQYLQRAYPDAKW
ncbi:MAG: 1,2-phenylacetyl-CoA epoxidase subunit PaaC [Saprospiraceae bacterium]